MNSELVWLSNPRHRAAFFIRGTKMGIKDRKRGQAKLTVQENKVDWDLVVGHSGRGHKGTNPED